MTIETYYIAIIIVATLIVIVLLTFVFNRGVVSNWHTSYIANVGYLTTNER